MDKIQFVNLCEDLPFWERISAGQYAIHGHPSQSLELRNKQAVRFAKHRGEHPSIIGEDGLRQVPDMGQDPAPPSNGNIKVSMFWKPNLVSGRAEKLVTLENLSKVAKYIKTIGYGGQGVIALCEFPDSRDKKGRPVKRVVKMAREDKDYAQEVSTEAYIMDFYRKAKHLCRIEDEQLLMYFHQHLAEKAMPPKPFENAMEMYFLRSDIRHAKPPRFLVIEHMTYGSLATWIGKANKEGVDFPTRLLWMMFHNLVQGLIGMCYPDRSEHHDPVEETIPEPKDGEDPADYEPCDLVHFDLDMHNVLVGANPDYKSVPIFKIADFGLSSNWSARFARKQPRSFVDERFWRQRTSGKPCNFAPEQFHEEWDSLERICSYPSGGQNNHDFFTNPATKPKIAGNYSHKTNIFQVGTVMWSAITQQYWNPPIRGVQVDSTDDPTVQHTVYEASGRRSFFQMSRAEPELLDLVGRCLFANPEDRPTLKELQQTINARLELGFREMSDERLAFWCKQFFHYPNDPDVGADSDGGDPPSGPSSRRKRKNDMDDEEASGGGRSKRRKLPGDENGVGKSSQSDGNDRQKGPPNGDNQNQYYPLHAYQKYFDLQQLVRADVDAYVKSMGAQGGGAGPQGKPQVGALLQQPQAGRGGSRRRGAPENPPPAPLNPLARSFAPAGGAVDQAAEGLLQSQRPQQAYNLRQLHEEAMFYRINAMDPESQREIVGQYHVRRAMKAEEELAKGLEKARAVLAAQPPPKAPGQSAMTPGPEEMMHMQRRIIAALQTHCPQLEGERLAETFAEMRDEELQRMRGQSSQQPGQDSQLPTFPEAEAAQSLARARAAFEAQAQAVAQRGDADSERDLYEASPQAQLPRREPKRDEKQQQQQQQMPQAQQQQNPPHVAPQQQQQQQQMPQAQQQQLQRLQQLPLPPAPQPRRQQQQRHPLPTSRPNRGRGGGRAQGPGRGRGRGRGQGRGNGQAPA